MIGTLTVFKSTRALAKTYALSDSGTLVKGTAAQMSEGVFQTRSFADVGQLSELIEGLSPHEAICASTRTNGSDAGRIVCRAALNSSPGALARTKDAFGLAAAPGLLFIDHDAGHGEALDRDSLWALLVSVVPALKDAGVIWRPSGSSHVCNGEHDLTGLRGQHVFALLENAADGPRVIKTIAARLWLRGHGQVELSSSGSMLVRCPVDTAPSDGARLIFAAGSVTSAPLVQRRGPAVTLAHGGFLDSRRLIPDLTADEQMRYQTLVEQAKSARLPEALEVRARAKAAAVAKRVPDLMKGGASAAEAAERLESAFDAALGGVLLGDFELTAVHDDGRREVVTVAEVLRDRERWHEVDTLVPMNESHRGYSPDARLFLRGASPILYSLDSGEVFRLRQQVARVQTAKGARGELVQSLCQVLADQDDVFSTDAGPVQIVDGRLMPLTALRLQNLIGTRVALFARGSNGKDAPTDLPREVADLVLAALA